MGAAVHVRTFDKCVSRSTVVFASNVGKPTVAQHSFIVAFRCTTPHLVLDYPLFLYAKDGSFTKEVLGYPAVRAHIFVPLARHLKHE